jgi:hypothetical protein
VSCHRPSTRRNCPARPSSDWSCAIDLVSKSACRDTDSPDRWNRFQVRFVGDTIPELYHHVFIVGAVVTKLDIPEEARKELEVDEAVSSALRRPLIASMLSCDPERNWFRIAKACLISSTRPALTSVSAPFRMTRRLPLPARRTFASIGIISR